MSIHINEKRKQYFICYKVTQDDGKQKTITITNANWKTNLVGKKYMQSIEQEEVEKDKKKRKLRIKRKDGSTVTLEELRYDFISYQYNHLKEITAYRKEKVFDKYIYSYFKLGKPLDEVFTIQTVNGFISKLSKIENIQKNTLNQAIGLLKETFEFAMKMEYIPFELGNKLSLLLNPLARTDEIKKDKIKVWTKEELDIFFNSYDKEDKFFYLFDLVYKGALRIGEALALKWEDLDVQNNRINIYKTLADNMKISTPKTKSSNNYVYLPTSCIKNLLTLKEMLCASDDDYMFFSSKLPISKQTAYDKFVQKVSELKLTPLTPHGLRHSCATTMIYNNIPIQDISHHLRHQDIGVTLRTYVHWLPNNMQQKLDDIF